MEGFGRPLMWSEPPAGAGGGLAPGFQLPAGTVTFLLTDIEGSTRLWESAPEEMPAAVADTYSILDVCISRHGGVRPLEQGEGDSVVAAFSRASDALLAALDAQRSLHAHAWPDPVDLRVRIALHTADAQIRDEGNYFGVALSRCARIRAIARGGQTLLSHATHDLVVDRLPEGAEVVDCGTHRLRDLGRPEHVYALTHPELPSDFEPLRSLDTFPNNLPDQLTSFVGRARELSEIASALPGTRLLTLTGAGGAGKTRLALQVAADASERFDGGAWWVELAPLANPEEVGEAIAAAVGVRPLPGVSALQASTGHIAAREALVLLDNCEHLLAACGEAADALLHGCPAVTVIATSRTPLGVAGETEWRVPSLSLPGSEPEREPIDVLDQSDAVRLFIERARKARPNFAVTNDNAPAVAQICTGLDGLPLAIELAAARVRMLTVEQIAAALSDRFHLLTGGVRTAMPRQQTLRASVEWSHDLLSEAERTLFRRLAPFAGGFTLDACERVGEGDGLERIAVLDLLGSLVDRSLVVAEEQGPAVRYRLLETVRQYALERLVEAGDLDAVRDRHLDAFLELAEQVASALEGTGQQRALDVLDADAGNFAVAIETAAALQDDRGLRLCIALSYWWRLRGDFGAAERACAQVLEATGPEPSGLKAHVLARQAYLLIYGGKYVEAWTSSERAAAMAERVGDGAALGRALNTLGLLQLQGDPLGARANLERAMELARVGGDNLNHAFALINLGLSHTFRDEYDEAEALYDDVEPLAARLDYREILAWAYVGRAWARLVRGEMHEAVDLAERAIAAAREVGDAVPEAVGVVVLAAGDIAHSRPADALDRLEASHARLVRSGAGLALPYVETTIASVHDALGHRDEARDRYEAVIAGGADFGRVLAQAKGQLAGVLHAAGDDQRAAGLACDALESAERIGAQYVVAGCKELLGRISAAHGDWSAADGLLHEALTIRAARDMWFYLPQTLEALAEVAVGLESHEEATRLLGAAARMRRDLGLVRWPPDEPRTAALESRLRDALGDDAFGAAWDEGAGLTPAEAVAWVRRARGERKRPSRGWESLTPTERQVAALVAEGLTNPQIGERMFISRGTVKVHVGHILAKLGLSTRAQVAADVARHERAVQA